MQIVRAVVFAPLADGVPAETVAGLYRDGVASGALAIHGHRADAAFLDVGTPRDYLQATRRFETEPGRRMVESGADVASSARVERCVVWAGVRIGAGADLEDCIAAGGVRVPAGFVARHAVLVPAALARAGDHAEVRDGVAAFPL